MRRQPDIAAFFSLKVHSALDMDAEIYYNNCTDNMELEDPG